MWELASRCHCQTGTAPASLLPHPASPNKRVPQSRLTASPPPTIKQYATAYLRHNSAFPCQAKPASLQNTARSSLQQPGLQLSPVFRQHGTVHRDSLIHCSKACNLVLRACLPSSVELITSIRQFGSVETRVRQLRHRIELKVRGPRIGSTCGCGFDISKNRSTTESERLARSLYSSAASAWIDRT